MVSLIKEQGSFESRNEAESALSALPTLREQCPSGSLTALLIQKSTMAIKKR